MLNRKCQQVHLASFQDRDSFSRAEKQNVHVRRFFKISIGFLLAELENPAIFKVVLFLNISTGLLSLSGNVRSMLSID